MGTRGIVVINSGSTSLKFAAYQPGNGESLSMLYRGSITELHNSPQFVVEGPDRQLMGRYEWGRGRVLDHAQALAFAVDWLERHVDGLKVAAAGHRIVLGGPRFAGPVLIEGDVLAYLEGLSAMEPSHQPANVAGARAFAKLFGHVPQVACFDSSFHRTMPEVAQTYALPADLRNRGLRHWGFHGLSFEYISEALRLHAPHARRVVVAHLGGGSSLCAMLDGKSIDTTMGFSGLSGLPMATRSGDVPPEILFYLLRDKTYDADTLERLLYENSGLLGLSGISGDMQTLLDSTAAEAVRAVDYYVYQIVKHSGAYAAALGGLDAFAFTAGIGEHAASLRRAVCQCLRPLGICLDEQANARGGPLISPPGERVSVWVIPTNEELMIARHTLAVTRSKGLL